MVVADEPSPEIEILRPYVKRIASALNMDVAFWSGVPIPITAIPDEEDEIDWAEVSRILGVPIDPEKDTDVDVAQRMLESEPTH